ncbi:unnamed protein product [Clonostachys rosea]|uniref:N-acetyltransferase domain-containing protein n=1 Tax=Bionectria ochroleuca TaxID=29856 RepID=A0ABY6TQX4_BIOOC|nr:unnamed protein product [Clonostachys rosea]
MSEIQDSRVAIKTTLPVFPLPPNEQRRAILTERLLLRPFNNDEEDAQSLNSLRSEPDTMKWSSQGRPDKDLAETKRNAFVQMVPPNDTQRFIWLICLKSTGEFIGLGGVKDWVGDLGWPEAGYMLMEKAWGQGYATEFLRAFLEAWWALPRQETEITVDVSTVVGNAEKKQEVVFARTGSSHSSSQNVLKKAGFQVVKERDQADPRDPTKRMTIFSYIAKKK